MKFQVLEIELVGIRGTITQYTRNPYVIGYLDSLEKYVRLRDAEMTKTCISKILNWYSKNYDNIQSSEYVFNKEDHKNTSQLLKEIYHDLDVIQK
jgi:hypothetical protein